METLVIDFHTHSGRWGNTAVFDDPKRYIEIMDAAGVDRANINCIVFCIGVIVFCIGCCIGCHLSYPLMGGFALYYIPMYPSLLSLNRGC